MDGALVLDARTRRNSRMDTVNVTANLHEMENWSPAYGQSCRLNEPCSWLGRDSQAEGTESS